MNFSGIVKPAFLAAIEHVANEHGVTITAEDLIGRDRHWILVEARHMAIRRMYDSGKMRMADIGRVMRRDPSTIFYALGKLPERRPRTEVR